MTNPSMLVNIRGTELSASDTREQYRQKLARITLDSMVQFVGLLDANGTVLEINHGTLGAAGIQLSDVEGKPLWTTFWWQVSKEINKGLRDAIRRAAQGECVRWDTEVYGRAGGKETIIIDASLMPVKDEYGKVVFIVIEGRDITKKKIISDISAHKEAEEASRLLAAIVESSDDAIASKDLNGVITSWNQSAERLFGYKAEEIIGKPVTLIIPPELHQDEPMILAKIRRGERIEHFETVRITKTGEHIDVSLTISPVKDADGKIVGAAKIVRNITENKKIERALRTTEKLAAAGRLAATVAHEINNPLAAVTNLVYLSKRDADDSKKVAEYLDLASRELDRVAHIARQTLGFYRDTSSPIHFNVAQALDDLLLLYANRFEGRKIKVIKQYDEDIQIIGLAGEIRQAFSNLITNSIDAMPAGGSLLVRVSKSHAWTNSQASGIRITILDTGSGIAPQHMGNLFQPFFTTKEDVGTGLGLWITRNIVEKHGGVIYVKSRTGPTQHGTAFSIFLPLEGKDNHQE
ncbi:MAG TPA: PAS domain S-box protein, partial [Verrucomicrobiae bacterium]|nr:PAS domain S-box protein [Verrucomicrobiae bacterium]